MSDLFPPHVAVRPLWRSRLLLDCKHQSPRRVPAIARLPLTYLKVRQTKPLWPSPRRPFVCPLPVATADRRLCPPAPPIRVAPSSWRLLDLGNRQRQPSPRGLTVPARVCASCYCSLHSFAQRYVGITNSLQVDHRNLPEAGAAARTALSDCRRGKTEHHGCRDTEVKE